MPVRKTAKMHRLHSRSKASRKKNAGVVLITILLIFASVTVMVVAIQRMMIQSTSQLATHRAGVQAQEYLFGAEVLASVLLAEDQKQDQETQNEIDHPAEAWAQIQEHSIDGGGIRSRLIDLQGKLNIADLGTDKELQAVFLRLLQILEIPSDRSYQAQDVLNIILDWIDIDNEQRGFLEAEDYYYLEQESFSQPQSLESSRLRDAGELESEGKLHYLTAQQPFQHLSELLLLRGINRMDWVKLSRFVSVLPSGTPLNLNSISSELAQALMPSGGDLLVSQRPETGYTKEDLNQLPKDQRPKLSFGVNSDYFELKSQVFLSDHQSQMSSVLWRKPLKTTQSSGAGNAGLNQQTPSSDASSAPVKVIARDRGWNYYYTLSPESEDGNY